jgi:signal transduction histidine kinase
MSRALAILRGRAAGLAAAVVVPIAITAAAAWLRLPSFVFEHLIVLLVVGFAMRWGLPAAGLAATVAVLGDNVVLDEPFGQPGINGVRDWVDLALFAAVAFIVSSLVTVAREARLRAEESAERERRAREDRDRLIATVSHDLATPLAVLAGTVQFASRAGPNVQTDLPRLLARIDTATKRAMSLVNTLADVHALDSDGFILNIAAVDLREVVTPVVDMLDRLSSRHPIVLATPDHPVIVEADAERLQRVVENLVNNAIKYSPEGGPVEVSLIVGEGDAVLSVRDYGIGISPQALPHIFDRSYRAPEAQSVAPGLGLGLNIAAQIVARHGGTVTAQAAEPRGAIVSLRMPLEAAQTRSVIHSAPYTVGTVESGRG